CAEPIPSGTSMLPSPGPNGVPDDDGDADDPQFLEAVQKVAERCRAGEPVDEATLRRDYPQYAEALKQSLPAMHLLAALGAPARVGGSTPPPDPLPGALLADFEDLQPIGQGA